MSIWNPPFIGLPSVFHGQIRVVGVAQSTVSQHLKILADVRFVLAEAVGNSRRYRVNRNCVAQFPSAADVVMGKPAPCQA